MVGARWKGSGEAVLESFLGEEVSFQLRLRRVEGKRREERSFIKCAKKDLVGGDFERVQSMGLFGGETRGASAPHRTIPAADTHLQGTQPRFLPPRLFPAPSV